MGARENYEAKLPQEWRNYEDKDGMVHRGMLSMVIMTTWGFGTALCRLGATIAMKDATGPVTCLSCIAAPRP